MVCYLDLIGFNGMLFGFNESMVRYLNLIGFNGMLLGFNRISWYVTWF